MTKEGALPKNKYICRRCSAEFEADEHELKEHSKIYGSKGFGLLASHYCSWCETYNVMIEQERIDG